MKYETKLQIQSALSKRGWMHAAQVINEFIEILEATDEQKALRADAERYRFFRLTFGLAVWSEDGEILWHEEEIDQAIDEAIDKARGA